MKLYGSLSTLTLELWTLLFTTSTLFTSSQSIPLTC